MGSGKQCDNDPMERPGHLDAVPAATPAELELREEKRTLELLNQTGAALSRELDLDRLVQTITDAGSAIRSKAASTRNKGWRPSAPHHRPSTWS